VPVFTPVQVFRNIGDSQVKLWHGLKIRSYRQADMRTLVCESKFFFIADDAVFLDEVLIILFPLVRVVVLNNLNKV
jgi:hypothetical protein